MGGQHQPYLSIVDFYGKWAERALSSGTVNASEKRGPTPRRAAGKREGKMRREETRAALFAKERKWGEWLMSRLGSGRGVRQALNRIEVSI